MRTVTMTIELELDEDMMYGNDKESKAWFFDVVLKESLYLHSEEIGDNIGRVSVIDIEEVS